MSQSYLVSYDLRGRDETSERYTDLIAAIKAYGYWGKLMLSTWIIVSESSATEIRDQLQRHMDSSDRIFVGPIGKPAAWSNLMADSEWMKKRP